MTLNDAIEHCEEVANRMTAQGCEECAEDHRQLAKWLNELKWLREQKAYVMIADMKGE